MHPTCAQPACAQMERYEPMKKHGLEKRCFGPFFFVFLSALLFLPGLSWAQTAIDRAEIDRADLTVTVPVTGNRADTTPSDGCDGNFFCGTLSWSPSHNQFQSNTIYTATVMLTARDTYIFNTPENFTATINEVHAEVTPIGSDGSQVALSYQFAATDTTIAVVALTVAAPMLGNQQDTVATAAGHNCGVPIAGVNFTCSAITWGPSDGSNLFKGNIRYSAEVTLTPHPRYTFTGLTTATINGNNATVLDTNGHAVVFRYQFAPTAAGILSVLTQPELDYTEGSALDLSELFVRLIYGDGTKTEVSFADFAEYNLQAEPANGTVLNMASHDGMPITVAYNFDPDIQVKTNPLTVTAAATLGNLGNVDRIRINSISGGACNTAGGPFGLAALVALAALRFKRKSSR